LLQKTTEVGLGLKVQLQFMYMHLTQIEMPIETLFGVASKGIVTNNCGLSHKGTRCALSLWHGGQLIRHNNRR
jgi:hypothetical protein